MFFVVIHCEAYGCLDFDIIFSLFHECLVQMLTPVAISPGLSKKIVLYDAAITSIIISMINSFWQIHTAEKPTAQSAVTQLRYTPAAEGDVFKFNGFSLWTEWLSSCFCCLQHKHRELQLSSAGESAFLRQHIDNTTYQASSSEETNWKNQTLKKAASEENVPQNGVACYYETKVQLVCIHHPVNPSVASLHCS